MSAAGRRRDGATGSESGFALLIVLWAVVLLALLATQLTATGRTELRLAANLRAAAAAEAAADGAVQDAVFHLLAPADPWPADGGERALLRRAGAEGRTADGIAAAIVDWRFPGNQGQPGGAKEAQYRAAGRPYGPAGAPFRSVAELGAVLGMTPELLARLEPNVSVLTDTDPDLSASPPLVRQAIADLRGSRPTTSRVRPLRTVSISAQVVGDAGGRFGRRAVVRLGIAPKEALVQILTWEAIP